MGLPKIYAMIDGFGVACTVCLTGVTKVAIETRIVEIDETGAATEGTPEKVLALFYGPEHRHLVTSWKSDSADLTLRAHDLWEWLSEAIANPGVKTPGSLKGCKILRSTYQYD